MAFQILSKNSIITVSTANSNLDGSGTIGELMTGTGTFGDVVESIRIQSRGPVFNGMVRLFIKGAGGGSWYLIKEIPVPASAGSNSPITVFGATIATNIYLENGAKLGVSTQVADTFNIVGISYEIAGFI